MRQILFPTLLLMVITSSLRADDPQSDKKPPAETQESSEKSKEQSEKAPPSEIELTGTIEAVQSSELMVNNEHLTELKLERILAHGSTVKEGAPVVWFETEDLDEQLKTAEINFKLAELQHEADEFAYTQFVENQQLDRAAAQRARDEARNDYEYFMKTQLDRDIARAEQSLKSAEFSTESAKEELDQLTQMYQEDDLTEQSEEIVLRRAKYSYETALERLTDSKLSSERSLSEMIPRSEIRQKETLDRALLAYDKAIHDLENARQKRDLEMDRSQREFAVKKREFEEMRDERNSVVLRAEHDGIVLYGKLERGKLPPKEANWSQGDKIAVRSVIATVVDPTELQIRIDLPEEHLSAMRNAKSVIVTSKGAPDAQFSAKVEKISDVPYVPGKFDCVLSIPKDSGTGLLPGMSCQVKIEKEVE